MAKTQDLKRRIRSIRNTMQLTRAMKMVSAAKLRRAQDRILAARPYSLAIRRLLGSLVARADPELHPLLMPHASDRRVGLVVITADKGLCGAFNAGIVRLAQSFARERLEGRELSLVAVGKKGRDHFARRMTLSRTWIDVFRAVDFATAKEIAHELMRAYLDDELDEIHLVYNEFKSAIQARPTVQRLLPIEALRPEHDTTEEYLYEPSPEALFAQLLPHYVETQVYHALLESAAAEHAARMAAMDSATKNAGELIESLTLTMNRVRQASITTEIIEVVSGAQALG